MGIGVEQEIAPYGVGRVLSGTVQLYREVDSLEATECKPLELSEQNKLAVTNP